MKKTSFLILLLLGSAGILWSNPVALPIALINEFKFENDNSWVLEIGFAEWKPYLRQDFDSICVSTSFGRVKLNLDNVKDSTSIIVFYPDSLVPALSINPHGDRIKLYSYLSGYGIEMLIDSLTFGNYPGSMIDSLQTGYSIAAIYRADFFVKDKSPTIGLPNDTVGTCAALQGYIFDKNNNPVTNGILIIDNPLLLQGNGRYITSVFSRILSFWYLENFDGQGFRTVKIDPIQLNIEPDMLIEKDIHLLDDYVVKVEDEMPDKNSSVDVINYPNPFNSATNFYVSIPSSLKFDEMKIDIYDVNGQRISTLNSLRNNTLQWDGRGDNGKEISAGTYYYQLLLDHSIYKSGKIIYLK